ncbi:anti-sigma factor [Pseudomonas sp. PCH199]|uniref:anti-sigma factor n=1 Tax=unclassified Pseudomonas TaxID=196821 RepID=UPI000BCE3776|nr:MULTISPECIES: anti-sigma factor [unclassified Pseudomonas]MCW8274788.1 anti-sigma factor [Pseudomonas sp. PCH199]PAM85453.1 anti-sigma factor [Pseudomonas sp. ERMR1:02]
MNYQTQTLRRALAADYAIGLMPPVARRRFEQLLLEDAALRVELAQWQENLASLTAALPEQPVPDRVWQGITARIEPQELHVPQKRPFWNWLRVTVAVCSLLIAVTLGVIYNRDDARYSATLVSADAQPALKVRAHENYLQVEPLTLAAIDPQRSLELWAIPADGKPVSLGVIPAGGKGKVELNDTQKALIGKPVSLAVSLEPKGGSPTGQPTGPVLYQGALAAL